MAVTHKAHVPKFGDWESEDIPYTACFDHARQSKSAAGAKFNPNDPEDNPEAFTAMMTIQRRAQESDKVNADLHRVDHQHGARNQKSNVGFTSESGTERSSSDFSLIKKKRQNDRSDRTDNSSSRSDSGHRRHRRDSSTSNNQSFDHGNSNQHKFREQVSIPKFGSWDVNDPKSGEAFTSIFDKAKEQKQSNSSAAYMVTTTLSKPPKDQTKREKPCISKICCCLF